MATLIQAKQIEGIVTASVIQGDFSISGSLNVSGSGIFTNDITASGIVSASRVLGVNYDDINGTPTFQAGTGISITQVGDNITITNTGGGGTSGSEELINSVALLNAYTASNDIVLSGINQTTASLQSQINALVSATSSYITSDSDSQTLTIVGDQLTISDGNTVTIPTGSGGVSSWNDLTDIPSGLVSGSVLRTLDGTNVLSASVTFEQFSASLASTIDSIQHTQIPQGTISSSQQIADLGFITSSNGGSSVSVSDTAPASPTEGDLWWKSDDGNLYVYYDGYWVISVDNTSSIPSGVISGSTFTNFSSSIDSKLDALIAATSSYLTSETDSQTLSIVGNQLTISSGNTITIPTGSGGESTDITALNTFTSSIQSQVDSLTSATSSYLTELPSGLVSGSVLRSLDGTGVLSSSIDFTTYSASAAQNLSNLNDDLLLTINDVSDSLEQHINNNFDDYLISSASFDSRISILENQTDNTGSDTQSLSIVGDQLTISGGNTITIPTGSGVGGDVSFDGNRIISNEDLGDLFTNSVNPGTSGSIQDFLNAVFYPNSAPIISTGNQTIEEYRANGASIVTLSGTDPEGQTLTWGTGSSYTDDLVRVASNGVMTLNTLAESSSFNTDSVGGVHGHLVTVTATDTFGTETEKDIYIIVTPNEAPVFRETSTSGNIITSVTANLNESSTDNTLVKRIFFTDIEGDSITIYSSSIDNNHFDIEKFSTYVDIRQNTSSLDYEQQTQYTFSISASDEHYESGQDTDSITSLLITVNVTDNLTPTINNQTLSSINENSAGGTTVGTLSASDNEGNTITFTNFTLSEIEIDGNLISLGTYSGTSQLTDPTENPFQMNSSGVVTRKAGVFLNSDLINTYRYTVQVTDAYNGLSSPATITINITDDTAATLSDNFGFTYIIESATSGTAIRTNTNGFSGTVADLNSNQSGTWSSSNPAISINSIGNLSLGLDLSGSVTQSGDIITTTITFTNTFGTTTTQGVTTLVAENQAPTATFTDQSANFNTNLATQNTNLVSVSITDAESDTPYQLTISGVDGSSLNAVPQNADSSSWQLQTSSDLLARTYTYDVTVTDSYSKSTTYSDRSFTIAQADYGTLGGDTTSYIIESAESGDVIRDASGFGAGNSSQLSVSYSPNYGSQVVQSYTSSNSAIAVDGSGNLTLGVDISGSVTQSGEVISSIITFQDQYGNVGSGSVDVNVFANHFPSASFTQNTSIYNENEMVSGSLVESFTITDTESDVPYIISLSGTDASKIEVVPQNSNTSSVQLKTTEDLSAGTYTYTVSVSDSYSKTSQYDRSVTIASADLGTMSTNGTFYIIESATTGNLIRTNSSGRTGTQGDVNVSYSPNYGSQVAGSFTSSNGLIAINPSTGQLSVGNNISGSGNVNGDTITSTIGWTDQYGNNGSDTITVNVSKNNAPTVSGTSTQNLNTNQATGSSQVLQLQLTDVEGDSIPNSSLSFSGYNTTYFTPSISSPYMRLNVNNTSVPSGTYSYTASIQDIHAFETRVHSGSFTIAQASKGTLTGDRTSYIIESAESGDVLRDATGYNAGNPSQLTVVYLNYGSPVVQSYTSSNEAFNIDTNGNITLAVDISGSTTGSGAIINSLVTFVDQYGNVGSGSLVVNVFANQAPAANFTATSPYDTDGAISGSTAGTLTVTDIENNSPFVVTLGGTDGGKFDVQGSSSPFTIQPTGSLNAGSYSINITVTDNYGESVTLTNESIVVDDVVQQATVYVYTLPIAGDYDLVSGITAVGSGTPPEPTIATSYGFFTAFVDNDTLGDSSITVSYGSNYTANLRGSGTGDNLDTILDNLGALTIGGSPASERIYIMIPYGSGLTGVPSSLTISDPGGSSTSGEYVVFVSPDGTFQNSSAGLSNDIKSANIHKLTLDTAVDGYADWIVIGTEDRFQNPNAYVRIVPSSGSVPS